MARGRQKAKHMKVARRLKYYSPEPDLDALQRELSGTENETGDSEFAYSDDGETDQNNTQDSWTDPGWDNYPSR